MNAAPNRPAMKRVLRRGFTYLDIMVAVVIIGVAVAALMQSMTTSTQVNATARRTQIAVNLVRHVHERAMSLNMAGLDALNGQTFSTPIGADGQTLAGYAGWDQKVSVGLAPINDIQGSGGTSSSTKIRRVMVEARYKGAVVHRESWLLAPVGL